MTIKSTVQTNSTALVALTRKKKQVSKTKNTKQSPEDLLSENLAALLILDDGRAFLIKDESLQKDLNEIPIQDFANFQFFSSAFHKTVLLVEAGKSGLLELFDSPEFMLGENESKTGTIAGVFDFQTVPSASTAISFDSEDIPQENVLLSSNFSSPNQDSFALATEPQKDDIGFAWLLFVIAVVQDCSRHSGSSSAVPVGNTNTNNNTTQSFTLDSDSPSINTTNLSVNENTHAVGKASVSTVGSITWAIEGSSGDNNLFNIDPATGDITWKANSGRDFEAATKSAAGSNVYTLTVSATNAAGNKSTQAIAVNLLDVNEPPITTVATPALSIGEDAAASAVKGISVSDVDAGINGIASVRLTVAHGSLDVTVDVAGGLTAADISGKNTGTLTLSGSAAVINATLATLSYSVTRHYTGLDSLSILTSDGGSPALTSGSSVAISVGAGSHKPTLAGIPAIASDIITSVATDLADFRVNDADGPDTRLYVTLSPSNGSIGGFTDSLTNASANSLNTHLMDGTVYLTGTAAQINAALAATTFTANAANAASIAVSVSDVGLGDSTSAASGIYRFTAYNPPRLALPSGRNNFVNASNATLDVEVTFDNFAMGNTVQLKLGNTDLGSIHTVTTAEVSAHKATHRINKGDLGSDGAKSVTAQVTQGYGKLPLSNAVALTLDTVAPTLTITSDKSALKSGETASITFTFSEAPTGFDATDVHTTGGTLGSLSGSGNTRTATFTPTADTNAGSASISVDAGSYTDAAGNSGGAGTLPAISFDTKAPTLVITSDKSALKSGETASITFTFSEAPTGFDATDVHTTGGTLGSLSGSGTTRTATFTPTADTNAGSASISVDAGSYTDAAGNGGGAGTLPTISFDTKAPTLVITSDKSALKSGETASITFTFSEAPTGFDATDVHTTGGTLGSLSGSGTTRTATFTPTADTNAGSASISVDAGSYTDAAGNDGGACTLPTISFDTRAPTLVITSDKSALKSGETASITFTFSEAPTGFDATDVHTTGGTLGSLSGSGNTRTATFTPTADTNAGSASISVDAGSYTDAAGNSGGAGTLPAISFDTKAPTLVITSDKSALKSGETASITFTFSEAPTGFDATDVHTTGGTLGSLSGSGTTRTAIFTPTADTNAGSASISVDAGSYTDAAGNSGGAGTLPAISFDTKAPTLVITSDKSALKSGETASITFTFSEAPTGFDATDVHTTGGTLGSLSGSGTTRTAIFTPTADTNAGSASISVDAGSYTDAAGNSGGAGTLPAISFDTKAPTLVITSDKSALKSGETASITFTFSEAPTGFDATDVHTTSGTLGSLSGSGNTRTAIFTPTADTNAGSASISVDAGSYTDAAGNSGGAGTLPAISFDTRAPTLVITSDKSALKSGETASITFTFSEAPTGFDATDVHTTGGTLGSLSGSGNTRTATFTPTADTNAGSASISVDAGSYTDAAGNSGGAGTLPAISFDTKAPTLVITSDKSALKSGETASITFTFSEAPTGFDATDVHTTGGTLGSLSGSGTTRTATFTPTADTNAGSASISVDAGSYTDAAGNSGGAGTLPAISFDTRAPTLVITSDKSALKSGETASITFTFSEAPTGFDATDVHTIGGTLGSLSGSGNTRTAIFTPTADTNAGSASISVDAGSYTDAAGNSGGAGTLPAISFDTKAPTLVITSDKSALKSGETASITFTFSEAPTGFDATDVHTIGGTLGSLSGSGTTRTAIFTPTADTNAGSASISVDAGSYTDAAGNSGGAGSLSAISFGTKAPTLVITSDKSALKSGETASITFTFSEAPTGFDATDVHTTGGTLGSLSGSGTTRTATFTPTADTNAGSASISVDAGSYTDAAGNSGGAGTLPAISFDTKAPTLVITSDKSALKSGETASITFTFSEAPTGFDATDVHTIGGTLGSLSGSGTTRTAIFTPTADTNAGSASISVDAGSYTDAAGNSGGAGTLPAISFDTKAPTLVITSDKSALKSGETASITFTFSEAPTGFDATDVHTTSGTLGSLSGSGNTRTAIFTPTADTNAGSASISVDAGSYTDAAGNSGGAGTLPAISFDTKAPTLVITSDKSALKSGETASITFTFSEAPTGFDATDVHTIGGTLGSLSGSGNTRTAIFTPTADTNAGSASISVDAGSYTDAAGNSGGAGTLPAISFDTRAPDAPIVALGVGVSGGATAAEATGGGGVVTVIAESGSSVAVTFSDGDSHSVIKMLTGTGSALAVTLLSADITGASKLHDGGISVSATATDPAGNVSTAGTVSFTLDTVIATPILKLGDGVAGGATAAEATASSGVVSLVAENDSTVRVHFTGSQGSVDKSLSGVRATSNILEIIGIDVGHLIVRNFDGTYQSEFHETDPEAIVLTPPVDLETYFVNIIRQYGDWSRVRDAFDDLLRNGFVLLAASDLAILGEGMVNVSAVATDVAGNISMAGTSSFTLDTAIARPVLELGVGVADGATRAEAIAGSGVVTVNAENGSTVRITFSDSAVSTHRLVKTLIGTGAALAVALDSADIGSGAASLLDGGISVSAVATDAAGNISTAGTNSFTLDTSAPAAPVLILGTGVADGATRAEAIAGSGVVTVNAENGSTVRITFSDSAVSTHRLVKTLIGTGAALAVALDSADIGSGAASLLDGGISVSAVATDAAGNASMVGTNSFTLDTTAPAAPIVTLGAGVDDGATAAEATALSGVVTVNAENGSKVLVTFTDSADTPFSIVRTITGTGAAQPVILTSSDIVDISNFNNTEFLQDGPVSVSATATDRAGNTSAPGNNNFTLNAVQVVVSWVFPGIAMAAQALAATWEGDVQVDSGGKLDITPPEVTTTLFTVAEYQRSVGVIKANETVTWQIEGHSGDNDLFEINYLTGSLNWTQAEGHTLQAASHAGTADFTLYLSATDSAGNRTFQEIHVLLAASNSVMP